MLSGFKTAIFNEQRAVPNVFRPHTDHTELGGVLTQPQSGYLPYLDGWRGLAIFFLLAGHFFPLPGINFGAVGVNLFFVLSGFLMARLLFVDAVPIPTFYRRRAARIFPAVACLLAIIVAVYLATG